MLPISSPSTVNFMVGVSNGPQLTGAVYIFESSEHNSCSEIRFLIAFYCR